MPTRSLRRPTATAFVAAGCALAVVASGCSTSTSGGATDPTAVTEAVTAPPNLPDDPVAALDVICTATDTRIAELPQPPDQIKAGDWAVEVGRAWNAEATLAGRLDSDTAETQALIDTYATTVGELAAAWAALAQLLSASSDDLGGARDDLISLALGRDQLAAELGASACDRGTATEGDTVVGDTASVDG